MADRSAVPMRGLLDADRLAGRTGARPADAVRSGPSGPTRDRILDHYYGGTPRPWTGPAGPDT